MAANAIERVFRGHAGRLFFKRILQKKKQLRRLATFTYFALQLQKCFRGFYSRKYRQNHASRKRYLQHVVLVGQEVRESMKTYAKKQTEVLLFDSISHLLDSLLIITSSSYIMCY